MNSAGAGAPRSSSKRVLNENDEQISYIVFS